MKFSIIVPSYNQERFISQTLERLKQLKLTAASKNVAIEVLLFDNCSNEKVQKIIRTYQADLDYVEVEKDDGQYDAINKGIVRATGDYWTWLNTDDIIDIDGFMRTAEILKHNKEIDYIYGDINMIDESNVLLKNIKAKKLTSQRLTAIDTGIFQPGSFFKKEFTNRVGLLDNYETCFDCEYILRMLKNGAVFYKCDFVVSEFRYHPSSKSSTIVEKFIEEQLSISKRYGRRLFSFLTMMLYLRKIKRKIFN